jgi:succinate dehydrogenase / fumarate reductase, iron-sulfur subunit
VIVRVHRGKGEKYDDYDVEIKNGMTVLELLFWIQEKIDQTLAFRYSCRGAICGSCAVLANGRPVLACKTPVLRVVNLMNDGQVSLPTKAEQPDKGILLEPIPKLPVIRDLIVDWEPFFEEYRKLEPVLKANDNHPEKEYLVGKDESLELEKYTNCILCALCWGACPVVNKVDDYPGPAALAKLFRFYLDPRERGGKKRLSLADNEAGWWACDFHTNCRKVCPKGVPPNVAIGRARKLLKDEEEGK